MGSRYRSLLFFKSSEINLYKATAEDDSMKGKKKHNCLMSFRIKLKYLLKDNLIASTIFVKESFVQTIPTGVKRNDEIM